MLGVFDKMIANALGGVGKETKSDFASGIAGVLGVDWGFNSLFVLTSFSNANATNTIFSPNDAASNINLINAALINAETATITYSPVEEWIGGNWVYTHGRPELRNLTLTFRDTTNCWLYRNFATALNNLQNAYPDEQYWDIILQTHGPDNSNKAKQANRFAEKFQEDENVYLSHGVLLNTDKAMLDSLSSVNLDQSSVDGFITFSVTFKYINMVHNETTKAGTDNATSSTGDAASSVTIPNTL